MIQPINSLLTRQNKINLKQKNHKEQVTISFKAIQFLKIADKFKPIERDLLTETQKFITNGKGAKFLGRSLFSEVFNFVKFKDIVIKKPNLKDDFYQEIKALKAVSVSLTKSQHFVAQAYDDERDEYYLLSTKVEGSAPDIFGCPWNKRNLKGFFSGMFEMAEIPYYLKNLIVQICLRSF